MFDLITRFQTTMARHGYSPLVTWLGSVQVSSSSPSSQQQQQHLRNNVISAIIPTYSVSPCVCVQFEQTITYSYTTTRGLFIFEDGVSIAAELNHHFYLLHIAT